MSRNSRSIIDDFLMSVDFVILIIGFYYIIDIYRYKHSTTGIVLEQYLLIFLIYLVSFIISGKFHRVYQSILFNSASFQMKQLIKAHISSFALTILCVMVYEPSIILNRFIFHYETIMLCLTSVIHLFFRLALKTWNSFRRNIRYVLILGNGKAAHAYLDEVNDNPQLGYKVIGYLAPERNELDIPYLGDYSSLETVMRMKIVDLTVVAAPLSDEKLKNCLELLDLMGKTLTILLDDVMTKIARSKPINFDGLPMLTYGGHPRLPGQAFFKRALDIILSSIGLIIICPISLVIVLAIKVSTRGPVFFAQERVGLNGRLFKMLKFRTMVVNAEELKGNIAHLNEMGGPVFKITNDPRVTHVGRFLRKSSLDELPQLWNVLIGEMSLVGPRPPLPCEVDNYDPKYRKRLSVKPGITCIWQISGRNEVGFEEWMEMDVEYVDKWSIWMDMKILVKTVPAVLMRKGAS